MCQHTKNLYFLVGVTLYLELKKNYIPYCKNMTKAMTENRKTRCNKQILASNNTIKTMWNIIKTETNRKGNIENILCFSSGNDESYVYQDISDSFNNSFLSMADKMTLNIKIIIICSSSSSSNNNNNNNNNNNTVLESLTGTKKNCKN